MFTYRCIKKVEAALINDYPENDPRSDITGVVLEDGQYLEIPKEVFSRGCPEPGQGYLVKYEDGYISWSPKDVFEKGYIKE